MTYPAFAVSVATPALELRPATDDLLAQLAPLVHQGAAEATPAPYDDPMSLYESDPDTRVARWYQGIWRGRGTVQPDLWRLYFVVMVDGEAVGMQDLIGEGFATYGTVVSFSWLAKDARRRGMGREMRQAILHLAFDGLGATEATSEAFIDNRGSNSVSRHLGYEPNGTTWATRQGEVQQIQSWRLSRAVWESHRRNDITVRGADQWLALIES